MKTLVRDFGGMLIIMAIGAAVLSFAWGGFLPLSQAAYAAGAVGLMLAAGSQVMP
jgi:hypothetical protein